MNGQLLLVRCPHIFLTGDFASAIEAYTGRAAYYLDAASWATPGLRERAIALLSLPRADALSRPLVIASLVLISAASTSCGVGSGQGSMSLDSANASASIAPILLFNATGASPNDVVAVEAILKNNHLSYSAATSAQLNRMDQSQIRRYRLLIVRGGNFVEIGKSLTPDGTANIRKAVQDGLNYLGICGGGFLAGNMIRPTTV